MFVLFVYFWHCYSFELKMILLILRYIEILYWKFFYRKGYKWLLYQNQRVKNGCLGYKRYEALAKYIKPFFKKTFKWKNVSSHIIVLTSNKQVL